jgi:hypothetical protein
MTELRDQIMEELMCAEIYEYEKVKWRLKAIVFNEKDGVSISDLGFCMKNLRTIMLALNRYQKAMSLFLNHTDK